MNSKKVEMGVDLHLVFWAIRDIGQLLGVLHESLAESFDAIYCNNSLCSSRIRRSTYGLEYCFKYPLLEFLQDGRITCRISTAHSRI